MSTRQIFVIAALAVAALLSMPATLTAQFTDIQILDPREPLLLVAGTDFDQDRMVIVAVVEEQAGVELVAFTGPGHGRGPWQTEVINGAESGIFYWDLSESVFCRDGVCYLTVAQFDVLTPFANDVWLYARAEDGAWSREQVTVDGNYYATDFGLNLDQITLIAYDPQNQELEVWRAPLRPSAASQADSAAAQRRVEEPASIGLIFTLERVIQEVADAAHSIAVDPETDDYSAYGASSDGSGFRAAEVDGEEVFTDLGESRPIEARHLCGLTWLVHRREFGEAVGDNLEVFKAGEPVSVFRGFFGLSVVSSISKVGPWVLVHLIERFKSGREIQTAQFYSVDDRGDVTLVKKVELSDTTVEEDAPKTASSTIDDKLAFVTKGSVRLALLDPKDLGLEEPMGSCIAGPTKMCLNDNRFDVRVTWQDFSGNTGNGQVVAAGSDDSGLFWFIDPKNFEMLVKVIDGCALNGHYWAFAASTTNVAFELTITDTESGLERTYNNPLGNAAPAITDTSAFASCGSSSKARAPSAAARVTWDGPSNRVSLSSRPPVLGQLGSLPPFSVESDCSASVGNLCLNAERFRVEVEWTDFQGNTGGGRVVPLGSEDSGLFWFFDADNWEMLVKVLDGCGVNGHFWVLGAATTNVEYTLRVTDTETGEVMEYTNPLGQASEAILDTSAFPTCPK